MPKPILFCDFDGVLCQQRYWCSLPGDEFAQLQALLFGEDRTMVIDWMRGKHTAEDVNRFISERTGIPYERLWKTFVRDCETMQVSKEVLEKINSLRDRYTVILTTGNMDSFTRFTRPALNLDPYFDHISNSYHEGIHKTDNGGELFLKLADKYGAPISKCIALDDSPKVHAVFTALGGTAYLVTPEQDISFHLAKLLGQ